MSEFVTSFPLVYNISQKVNKKHSKLSISKTLYAKQTLLPKTFKKRIACGRMGGKDSFTFSVTKRSPLLQQGDFKNRKTPKSKIVRATATVRHCRHYRALTTPSAMPEQ
ncbi:hypothetical protein CEXT_240891 [Caerostris extrusa]|uniref:Uncharacterized protein n=1 Tax=Caerostris extrusa TaxID=172846 RepID=A0AAV4XD89_CAEEX|nr:hypothetical protein CEXT_240891 [Caerostris extrusa]